MFDLSGKTALITGGTRGLGKAIAAVMAQNGANVALNYRRDENSARATLEEIRRLAPRAILLKADLEDDAQVRAMVREAVAQLGRLDILVANAAATAFKPLLEMKPHNLQRTFNLSIGGFVAAVQEASKAMSDGGRIIAISGMDSVRHLPGHGALGAAKAAMESMVRDFAFELGPRGITVNAINFAYLETDSSQIYFGDELEISTARVRERSALKRLAAPAEVAAIVCMVAMPEASYLTGQTIMVDGGLLLESPAAP